eukprot:CAMPEP_0169275192 /NCGR_PEP_ID=MMETSP1016-20121227/52198_1 /TAXON_ID=342587 /ORGANISM="Karlodinium micrum, Strain CCMP2283" /LENGTH=85 /DNA_ID=CAMNT_0009361945 /DNA_START=46 /DNA_END=299 /DNA_ORIENTATION=-
MTTLELDNLSDGVALGLLHSFLLQTSRQRNGSTWCTTIDGVLVSGAKQNAKTLSHDDVLSSARRENPQTATSVDYLPHILCEASE